MDLAFWRDLSLIYLLIGPIIVTLLVMAVMYFAVRGMMVVNRKVGEGFRRLQHYSGMMQAQTKRVSDIAATPLVRIYGAAARAQTVVRDLTPGKAAAETTSKERS